MSKRKKMSPEERAMRKTMVRLAKQGQAREKDVHYSQTNRDGWLREKWDSLHFPMFLDCSSWYTLLCWLAKALDPSGYGYKQVGNSDSILIEAYKMGRVITLAEARRGDGVVFGGSKTDHTGAHHVSMLLQTPGRFIHRNPKLHRILSDAHVTSHGSEAGPVKMDLKSEIAWEPNYHIVRTVVDTKH
jgi:hypothetical protein